MTSIIKTRFAPSPTGFLHIGGVRTALFSWLYTKKNQGQFVLRIEDTDRERSTDEAIQVIIDGLAWLGLNYDEGPYYQTQHFDRYKEVSQQLLNDGKAYHCYCSKEALDKMREEARARGEKPKYNGTCREREPLSNPGEPPVIRFKNPLDGEVVINDLIQGRVVYQNSELDDLIIARSDGTPTYNLTVVVDDMDMKITHVIRGDDHLNNTPRQMNIFKALNTTPPVYAHVPLILGEDGKRLSKRHGAVSIMQYNEQGYLPEALLNYLVRLGWSHGDQEIFSVDEMIEHFKIEDVNKSAASINPDKLLWLNQHYIKTYEDERLAKLLEELLQQNKIQITTGPDIIELVKVQKERVKTLQELFEQSKCFFADFEKYDETAAKKHLRSVVFEPLTRLRDELQCLDQWQDEIIHQTIDEVITEFDIKLGKIAQPLRVAITGSTVSPSIDTTLRLLGKERSISRLDKALSFIEQRAA